MAAAKLTVIKHGTAYFIKRGSELHATRYPTKDKAVDAARRISAGLLQFQSITTQIQKSNLTNQT